MISTVEIALPACERVVLDPTRDVVEFASSIHGHADLRVNGGTLLPDTRVYVNGHLIYVELDPGNPLAPDPQTRDAYWERRRSLFARSP